MSLAMLPLVSVDERCRALFSERRLIFVGDVSERVLPLSKLIDWSNRELLEIVGVCSTQPDGSVLRVAKNITGDVVHTIVELALPAKPTSTQWTDALASDEIAALVNSFDPECRARVVGHTNLAIGPVAGRPVFGGRRANSLDYEKKLHFNAICDELGLLRPQSTITGSSAVELLNHVTAEHPTVWAHDANEFTSGGRGVRFMHSDMDPAVHSEFVDARGYVRISEFLPGPSCSISAFVVDGIPHVMPPVEQIVAARPFGQLVTVGISSLWLPSSTVRVQMSRSIRLLAEKLVNEVDYAGSVIIDGIVNNGTFFATEFNTRRGDSARHVAGLVDYDLRLLHLLALAGETDGVEVGRLGYKTARAATDHGYCSAQLPIFNPVDVDDSMDETFLTEGLNIHIYVEDNTIYLRADPTMETNRAHPIAETIVNVIQDFAGRHGLRIDIIGTPESLAVAAVEGRLRTA